MDRYPVLDKVNSLEDFKKLKDGELPVLAAQMRQYMIENIARCGGHLASSLGVVELTIAMHRASPINIKPIIYSGLSRRKMMAKRNIRIEKLS